jgi:hypothetical protein
MNVSGVQFVIEKVFPPALVPKEFRGGGHGRPGPVDLVLKFVAFHGLLSAGDTQALGLGYVPRDPTDRFAGQRHPRALPLVTDLDMDPEGLGPYFAPGVDERVVPQELYVPSHFHAVQKDAGWADRTDQIQWLPANLTEFDLRLQEKKK